MNSTNIIPIHKVGDKVKIRSDLVPHTETYYGIYKDGTKSKYGVIVCDSMLGFSGRIVTIKKIKKILPNWECFEYRIKEDNEEFMWTDEMFESGNCFFVSMI